MMAVTEGPRVILLREYQSDVIAAIERKIEAGQRRVILVAPTGAGKAVIIAAIVRNALAEGKRVLALAHTREIIRQTSRKLFENGVEHGIIAAGLVAHPSERVQLASIQTLWSRAMRRDRMALPAANMVIIDESYPNAMLLGATATPCRGDGCGLVASASLDFLETDMPARARQTGLPNKALASRLVFEVEGLRFTATVSR
jgi:DNA repair protein RadD